MSIVEDVSSDATDVPGQTDSAEATLEQRRANSYYRLALALLNQGLLVVAIFGVLTHDQELKGGGFLLFLLFGLGTAPLQLVNRDLRASAFVAFGLAGSITGVLLIGFLLVELHIWVIGIVLFYVVVALAEAAQIAGIKININYLQENPIVGRPKKISNRSIVSVILTVVGMALCIGSAAAIEGLIPDPTGLLGAISPLWYVGMVLLAASAVVAYRQPSWNLGGAVVAIQATIGLSTAIVFQEPIFAWTEKHVGVTEYILLHGTVDPKLDVYQAWPGLFAGMAWICHAVGVSNPLEVIARWWPAVIDLVVLLATRHLATRIGLSPAKCWFAGILGFLGNGIGQDYYSPQSVAFALAIVLFAISIQKKDEDKKLSSTEWVLFSATAVAIDITHQLTPYMVTAALVVLFIFGYLRSKLLPVIVLVPAVVWAITHYSVISQFLDLKQIGDFTANVTTQGGTQKLHYVPFMHAAVYCEGASALIVGLLAAVAFLQHRDKLFLTLGVCAASGISLLFFNDYGNEGTYRVILFAVPWLAIMAAEAAWRGITGVSRVVAGLLPVLMGTYIMGTIGFDYINVVRPDDLSVVTHFENTAAPGSVLFVIGGQYSPINDSPRYTEEPYTYYYNEIYNFKEKDGVFNGPYAAARFTQFLAKYKPFTQASRNANYYVVTLEQAEAELIDVGLVKAHDYSTFTTGLEDSPDWKVVSKKGTAVLLELKAR